MRLVELRIPQTARQTRHQGHAIRQRHERMSKSGKDKQLTSMLPSAGPSEDARIPFANGAKPSQTANCCQAFSRETRTERKRWMIARQTAGRCALGRAPWAPIINALLGWRLLWRKRAFPLVSYLCDSGLSRNPSTASRCSINPCEHARTPATGRIFAMPCRRVRTHVTRRSFVQLCMFIQVNGSSERLARERPDLHAFLRKDLAMP